MGSREWGMENDLGIRSPLPTPYSLLPTQLHQPRNIQSTEGAAEAVARALIDLASAFVDRSHDQVLQHFDVAGGFRFDLDGKDFFEAVHFDLHNTATGCGVNPQALHLLH